MPNDAKLGLVVGVGLVVAVAVLFARKESPAAAGTPAAVVRASESGAKGIKTGQAKPALPPKAATGTAPRSYRPEYEFVSETQPASRR
jgi:hypothetical protein